MALDIQKGPHRFVIFAVSFGESVCSFSEIIFRSPVSLLLDRSRLVLKDLGGAFHGVSTKVAYRQPIKLFLPHFLI